MSRKYKIRNQQELYFVTFTVVSWLYIFTRDCYRNIILNSLIFCQKEKGLEIYAWVIMTNHIHLIIENNSKDNTLENIIRDFKTFTSKKIIREIELNNLESRKKLFLKVFLYFGKNNLRNSKYQFWQQHYHPIELNDSSISEQRLNYIHENPLRAGFVDNNSDWIYSSARDYETKRKGILKINFLY